jgi:hypothetical protein
MKRSFYNLIYRYLPPCIRPDDRAVEMNPPNNLIGSHIPSHTALKRSGLTATSIRCISPDIVPLNGTIQQDTDAQELLENVRRASRVERPRHHSLLQRPLTSPIQFRILARSSQQTSGEQRDNTRGRLHHA